MKRFAGKPKVSFLGPSMPGLYTLIRLSRFSLITHAFHLRSILAAVGLAAALYPFSSFAGEYQMVKGKGVAVCEAYNSYLSKQKEPPTCDRDFPPGSPLKNPSWKELDPQKNKLLVLRIENYLRTPRDEKATKPWIPAHRENALDTFYVSELAHLALAEIDINNDGKPETVAKWRSFRCDTWAEASTERGPRWVAPLVVLDADKKDVDREKTYPLMQNPGKVFASNTHEIEKYFETHKNEVDLSKNRPKTILKESKYAPGVADLMGYDAFLFNKKVYFDKWDEQEGEKGNHLLSVYKTESNKTKDLCEYRWYDR